LPEIAPLGLTVHPQDLLVSLLAFHKPPQGRRPTMKCTLCGGQGHSPQQCANNWTVNNVPSSYANTAEVSVPLTY